MIAMTWKRRLPLVASPDTPCACMEPARKHAIAEVRRKAVDALWPETVKDTRQWRDLMLDIVNELRGL